MIELKKIERIFGKNEARVAALNGVELVINEGEMVALVGPSGSGKTTLLNIIGCIDSPTNGSYLLHGQDISLLGANELARLRNKHFGFVVQDFALIDTYTVSQNVELPLRYDRGVSGAKRRERVFALLSRLGIADKAYTLPTKLSGGQKQRVAIARALINNAPVLLADEPTGALDSKTGQEIISLFREINREGKTVIIVTHDNEVARQCDRVIELVDGRVASAQ